MLVKSVAGESPVSQNDCYLVVAILYVAKKKGWGTGEEMHKLYFYIPAYRICFFRQLANIYYLE